ncbi:hypothetical protein [Nocardioides stalactiti]|uniref:hypothetical protein n=1 Tax=Nocardioides stalactiti TaxID=2755356 RepID=UPI001602D593|nr:hypothetical protein [Nocardioides stalactiti]
MRRPGIALLAATALVGSLAACGGGSDGDAEADEKPSTSTSGTTGTATDAPTSGATESTDASGPPTTKDPTEDGGFAYLPPCDEIARSIVRGEEVVAGEQVEGKSCRFEIGEDKVLGRQLVYIARRGGGWPTTFKADELNDKLAEAADPGDGKYASSVSEIKSPKGWSYGLQFDEKVGKIERTSYRLLAFAENGDLLTCQTSVADVNIGAFKDWCTTVLEAVQP